MHRFPSPMTDRQIDTHADRQADRQTGRQGGSWTDLSPDTQYMQVWPISGEESLGITLSVFVRVHVRVITAFRSVSGAGGWSRES